jgi:GAF domain-containing protein
MIIGDIKLHMDRLRAKRRSLHDSGQVASPDKLLPFYVRIMTKLTDCERCSVFIHDPDRGLIWLKAGTGVDEHDIEVPKESSVVGDVISSGEYKIVNNLEMQSGTHKQVDEKTGFTTRNILCVPIKSVSQNEIAGAFELLNKNNNQEFTNDDQSLAEEVANHLQKQIDAIYLDQEIFGFTEQLYKFVIKATIFFSVFLSLIFIAALALLTMYMVAPSVIG